MSECLAAWFLAERLSMVVSPRPKGQAAHILEMAIELPGGHINVEVKAPHRPFPLTTQAGDDSDALRAVIKSANEQFARHEKNLLVIIPRLPVFFFEEPWALQRLVALKAFVIEETLRVAIDPATGGPAGAVYIAMRPSGEFVKPRGAKARRFTRTGGALLINEHVGMPMRYSAMLIHNPCALNRLPKDLWNGVDQFCEADGQWAWRSSECA
ncbi:MAG TPA: hypothetical protein VGV06_18000 [Methylomirabilota bacterium]|nr:hypothetical protein [Methylomirabilota bacterium]